MTTHQFYAVASASFLTIAFFQVQSNYMLKYFSPPDWLTFLMLGWGATLMAMAASQNYMTALLLRLLLGAFEAGKSPAVYHKRITHVFALGLVPGMIYFSTLYQSCFLRPFLSSQFCLAAGIDVKNVLFVLHWCMHLCLLAAHLVEALHTESGA